MDFSNRSASAPATPNQPTKRSSAPKQSKWARIGVAAGVASVVILLIAVTVIAATGSGTKAESEYVDSKRLQAVFLNTGQVYFGNITALNSEHFVVTNIYYLQTANNEQANANANVSLVKLGCELHEPFDQMVINRDQVTFWENLQDNGQVAEAVKTFKQQNPDGLKCADQSSSASTNSVNTTQNAASGNSGTTTNATGANNANNADN